MLPSQSDPNIVFPWEKETDYEFYILYDPALTWSDHPAFQAVIDEVYRIANIEKLITLKSPKAVETARTRRRAELASLLWYAYLVHIRQSVVEDAHLSKNELLKEYPGLFDETGHYESFSFPYVRISLNKNHYKISNPNNPHGITAKISEVLQCLHAFGLVEKKDGYNFTDDQAIKAGASAKQTRFRPDTPLEVFFNSLPKIIGAPPVPAKPKPDVFKRAVKQPGKKSRKAAWEPFEFGPICPILVANSKLVDAYNDFITTQRLTVVGARSGGFVEPVGSGRLRVLDLSRVHIRNHYHVGDDGHITYGRMHGGFWQSMKSESRHLIRINGEGVVTLDYKAMILNIAAALHHTQLPNDPYDIDFGFGDKEKWFQRKMIKQSVIIAINSATANEAYQAMREEFKDPLSEVYGLSFKKDVFDAIISALVSDHPFLKDVFFKKIGKDIFMHDADIARDIIRKFLDAGKLVLPIHDGFVAQRSEKDFLMRSMKAAWRQRFNTDIAIDEE